MFKTLLTILVIILFWNQNSNSQTIPPLRSSLQFLDHNKNGLIESKELNRPKIITYLTQRLKRRFSIFDCNNDYALDIAEVTIYGINRCYTKTNSELTTINNSQPSHSEDFKFFDRNNNGLIELNTHELNEKFVFWLTKTLWQKADCDKNNGIDSIEFSHMGFGGCSHENLTTNKKSNDINTQPYLTILATPEGPGPFPVIIYSHGAAGLGGEESKNKAHRYIKLGFGVILVDHYTMRLHDNISKSSQQKILKTEVNWRKNDLTSIIQAITKNDILDEFQISLMGMSRGGYVTLEGLLNSKNQSENKINYNIKSGILFYPSGSICFPGFFEFKPINKPLLILFGSEDLFLPMCWEKLITDIRHSQSPQIVKIYGGANHSFDGYSTRIKCKRFVTTAPMLNQYSKLRSYESYQTCNEYNAKAHEISIRDVEKFLITYAK